MPEANTSTNFLNGGGEMGELLRHLDWEKSSIGTPDKWPLSLRTTLGIILHSKFPMFLFWGPDLLCFYNDAYRPSLGNLGKHPAALGRQAEEVWPEIWSTIKPLIDQVLAGGEATWSENQLIPIHRNGRLENVYWTFSYSPVYDDEGQIAGVFVTCTETTKTIEDQQQLLLSEERFSRLIEQAPVAVALFSGPQFVITLANERVLEYWGRTRPQVMNKPLFEALPEAAGQGFEELLTGVYTTGERFVAKELTVTLERNSQLEPTYIDFVYEPFHEADGQIAGVMVICTEITEQVLARRETERRAAELQAVLESMTDGVYIGNIDGISLANQAALEQLGFTSREELNRHVATLADEIQTRDWQTGEIIPAQQQAFVRALNGERVIQDVRIQHRLSQQEHVVRCAASPVIIDGQVIAAVAVNTDVTKQRQAETALRESEEWLRLAVAATGLSIFDWDLTTDLVTVNDRFKQLLGLTMDKDVIGAAMMGGVVHPDDRDWVAERIGEACDPNSSGSYAFEHRAVTPAGERWLLTFGQAYFAGEGDNRRAVRIIGNQLDITDRKQAEQLIVQSEARYRQLSVDLEHQVQARTLELQMLVGDLRRSNDNLQQFASIASHDLQEPLRKIQSFGDILKTEYGAALGDGIGILERMQSAAARMSTLIKDLLGFSRISNHQETTGPVDLAVVVKTVLSDLEIAIQETGAKVTLGSLPTVIGDTTQLGQLFQNLLSNALKFRRTDRAPLIEVQARLVAASALPASAKIARLAPEYYRIDVIDNGIGFDEKYRDRIFQLFQRLHGKGQFAGTGIGLAICEKVVTNHGGTITATSQPGQGATFSIYLPG